jgi:hypothetical protein
MRVMLATTDERGASMTPCEEAESRPPASFTPTSPLATVSPFVRSSWSAKRT